MLLKVPHLSCNVCFSKTKQFRIDFVIFTIVLILFIDVTYKINFG